MNRKGWSERTERDKQNIKKLFRRVLKKDSNCVDVGAHRGDFLKKVLKRSPHGQHIGVEPIRDLANKLKKQFPNVKIFEYGLSDRGGKSSFYIIPELLAWSGLRTQQYPKIVSQKKIEIEIRTLDSLVDKRVDFINIDVKGAELEVLKGSENVIKKYRPVVLFEHALIHNVEYKTSPEKMFDLLTKKYDMKIFSLGDDRPLSIAVFKKKYFTSYLSGYDKDAETNFVAIPRESKLTP